jgi:hypothetical protein
VRELHELYCHWTDQTLSLRFDRERLWYEFLRAGFSAADLKRVVTYLQKEIRAERRNIGALKLSNPPTSSNSIASRKISISAAFVSSRQPHIPTRLSSLHLIRKSTISNATRYSTNSESFASTYAEAVRLLKPMCHDFRHLFVRSPRNSVTKYLFSSEIL